MNLNNLLNTHHLINPSDLLHPSPERKWTWSIFRIPFIWSSLPIFFIRRQSVCKLGQLLNTSHLIIPSDLLHPSPERTWTWSIVRIPFIWSSFSSVSRAYVILADCLHTLVWLSYPILFIRFQSVREIDQLFEYPSFDHPIHPLYPSPVWARRCTWSIVWPPLHWSFHTILFIRLQREGVSKLGQLLNTFHLIISYNPLHPSPGRTWTWSIFWIPLIWSSLPILFIRL